MNLDELISKGAFVPAAPIPTEVTWTRLDADGKEISDTFTVHIKRRSYGVMERVFKADPENPDRSINAQFISESVLFGDGGVEQMSYEQAFQLDPSLATVLMKAVREVNGIGRTEAKN